MSDANNWMNRAACLALLTVCSSAGFASRATAQQALGIDWYGDVYQVDIHTGQRGFIGWCGFYDVNEMARTSTGSFIAFCHQRILSIDPVTGAATQIATTAVNSVRAAAFDDADRLYVAHSTGLYQPMQLYELDPYTGVERFIGTMGVDAVQAMTFFDGTLLAWDVGHGVGWPGQGLQKVDLLTGATTPVGPPPTVYSNIQMMFRTPSSKLYGGNEILYEINPVDGSLTEILNHGFYDLRGADIILRPPFLESSGILLGQVELELRGATPFGLVAFAHGTPRQFTIRTGPFAGEIAEIDVPHVFASRTADAAGEITMIATVPPGAVGLTIQAADAGSTRLSNAVVLFVR